MSCDPQQDSGTCLTRVRGKRKREHENEGGITKRPTRCPRLAGQWRLEMERCFECHAPERWAHLKVPSTILKTTSATQPSLLLSLPNELLLQILEHFDGVGGLLVALTCKRLLHVASMKRLLIPSAEKHRGVEHGCSAMLSILRVVKPMCRGQPDTSWAPCCDCYRFRPKRKAYWMKVVGARLGVDEYPDCKILSSFNDIVGRWSRKSTDSYQCPECWCVERLSKYGQPSECEHC